jgi:hypothetical protein
MEHDAFKKRLAEVVAILCINICISCAYVLKVVIYIAAKKL